MANDPLDLSSEELNRYLIEKLVQKFEVSKKGTETHTDYSDLSLHNSIANKDPDKKVTVNGCKFISDISDEDHLLTSGDIAKIFEGDE